MRYILAIFLPPVAVLTTGRMGAAVLNLILTLLLWIPGVVHAFLVINSHEQDKRTNKLVASMRG